MAILLGAAVVVTIALILVAFFYLSQHQDHDGVPLHQLLNDDGFTGSVEEWIDSLPDEQKAEVEIAYESDLSSGYAGSKEAWLTGELLARKDSNGDTVVILPDGGEIAVLEGDVHLASESGDSDSSDTNSITKLTIEDVECQQGQRDVAVAVRLEHNPGIVGMTLSVSYDESALSLKRVENGSAFRGVLSLTHSQSYGTGCLFTWDAVEVVSGDVRDGEILTLYFDVANSAAPNAYPIVARCVGSAYDNSLKEVGISEGSGEAIVS